MTRALSETQLRARLRAVRGTKGGVIGFHTPAPWTGPPSIRVDGEDMDVAFCASTLALRERLVNHAPAGPRLVVLTDRTESELGLDVLARLVKRRLLRLEAWPAVMDLFGAREIDPRLTRESWIADFLIDGAPAEGYPPVPSGVLDADTVWTIVLREHLGVGDAQPDVRALLLWTLSEGLARYEASPAEMRRSVAERLATTAGRVGVAIMRAVDAGRGRDALPLGLVCRVLFSPEREREPALREAAVRLEPLLGGDALAPDDGPRWADAAESVVGVLGDAGDARSRAACVERADTLLRELRADEFAHVSAVMVSGFEQRLTRYVERLNVVVEDPHAEPGLERLAASATAVLEHAEANRRPDRAEAVRMSLRLVHWLGQRSLEPASFADAAIGYASEGGWVDRARTLIDDGDPMAAVAVAYRRLAALVTERRERENQRFAELLARWIALGSDDERVIPVERVLAGVVGPVAREAPVLLVVMDGMSYAVFHALVRDLGRLGWLEIVPADGPGPRTAVAALPSITEVSRTSLLCGALRAGNAGVEREGFASCPELVAISRSAFPPVLFHKADLVDGTGAGLAAAVRTEIARTTRQVVGVVINAVDDHLAKGDQLRVDWTVAAIRPLQWVLDAAREAGRVVVMTSDHGHVLERDLTYRANDTGGARHREDDGAPASDEVALRGARVLQPGGRVIAPWSERVRYGVRQNGYHGGATPQEVVVPLVVLSTDARLPRGWTERATPTPSWWETAPTPAPASLAPDQVPVPSPGVTPRVQAELFTPSPEAASLATGMPWIDRLFASPTFASQKVLAGRVVLPDDRVRACLAALDERGGKLTRAALARALDVPLLRVGGFVAALRRLLNVDGYPVVTFDETSDTVELNVALLTVQFEL